MDASDKGNAQSHSAPSSIDGWKHVTATDVKDMMNVETPLLKRKG